MKNNLMLCSTVFLLLFISLASSSTEVYKVNTEISLKLTCTIEGTVPSSAATMNLTLAYPNGTLLVDNQLADSRGNGIFNYTITFDKAGTYYPTLVCFDGNLSHSYSEGRYIITPSGNMINEGDSVIVLGSLMMILIISSVFLYVAIKSDGVATKTALLAVSFIGYLIAVLYNAVIVQQVLFGFESIAQGFETFLFITKTGVFLGFITMMIVILSIMLKAWRIKRGFDD